VDESLPNRYAPLLKHFPQKPEMSRDISIYLSKSFYVYLIVSEKICYLSVRYMAPNQKNLMNNLHRN